jgi:ketosteroid isomerase-like protein
MRSVIWPAVLVALAAASPAWADACPAQSGDQAASEVRAAFAAWNDAVIRKDLEQTMAIFSPSIHFQFQGAPDFGYSRLLAIYTSSFARENAPQWQPVVENVIGSPDMVTLFNEWKLVPAGGGDAIADYRGVDVFQREPDCVWRVVASLNYADKATMALSPGGHAPGPATVETDTARPRIARSERQVRESGTGQR